MADLTHITITLDQPTLQTIKMGLAALQLSAVATEARLNQMVQEQIKTHEEAQKRDHDRNKG